MEKIYFTNFLTKSQSLGAFNDFGVTSNVPKKKESVFIVPPIGARDYSKIVVSVHTEKSTFGKSLYKWEHFRLTSDKS